MKSAVKVENKFWTPITGYNKATLTELKTESFTSNGTPCTVTNAYFHVEGAKETNFEKFSITDTDDNANLDLCNMLLKAFGGKEIKEGEDPTQQLNRCLNKPCALLLYPQSGKDGKVYHHTARYGMIGQVPAVKPLASVGELFDYVAKDGDSKPAKAKAEPKEDDTGF